MKKPGLTAVGGKGAPAPTQAEEFYKKLEADILARTLWGEARGEGATGMQAVDERDLYFATALRVARRALAGTLDDNTSGGTHYHAASIQPYWARGESPVAVIGRHVFYRII